MPAFPGSTPLGIQAVEEYLSLQEAAADPGQRLIQLCVLDHSASGHTHVQCHFTNSAASTWIQLEGVTEADARAALRSRSRVRLHVHADAKKAEPAATADFVAALPKVTLSTAAAAMLADGDGDAPLCNICLEEYNAGAQLTCMPCKGLHKFHSHCLTNWLETKGTCPCCQWPCPKSQTANQMAVLMQPAKAECDRLAAAQLPPCRLIDDDDDDDDEKPHANPTSQKAEEDGPVSPVHIIERSRSRSERNRFGRIFFRRSRSST